MQADASQTLDASQKLARWDQQHFWHSFTQMHGYTPLVIERADGVWLHTTAGDRLLDGASSMWCNVHGHNHPRINAAIAEQLTRVAHCTSLGMGCDTTIRLAKRLADVAPGDLRRVLFSSDGSSAIEVALKAAFQYWRQCDRPQPQKTKFLAFGQAYHGDTVGAASVGGIDRFHAVFERLLFDVVRAPVPNGGDAGPHLDAVRALFERHAGELAAVVVEPLIQCAAGMVMHPPGFLAGLRELATEHQVLLIADEVAVGFGKTGRMFACEHEGVTPDFLCLGKGLTGGYLPMAATVTSDDVYRAFLGDAASDRQLYHGHTFCGNPLAAAAALASLDLFESDRVIEGVQEKAGRLSQWAARLGRHPAVESTRQLGIVAAATFKADAATGSASAGPPREPIGRRVAAHCLANGVWLRPQPGMLYVMPPLAITHGELDFLTGTIDAAIEAVTSVPVPRATPHEHAGTNSVAGNQACDAASAAAPAAGRRAAGEPIA
ncbi:MAG: adenosylmethionine--8-amino-7-oxononanoate transaminase [Planctomycetota bacterium]